MVVLLSLAVWFAVCLLAVSLCAMAKRGDRARLPVSEPGWVATVMAPVVRAPAASVPAPRAPQLN